MRYSTVACYLYVAETSSSLDAQDLKTGRYRLEDLKTGQKDVGKKRLLTYSTSI